MGKLTEKQKKFCEEYLVDLNAVKAAKRAGYSNKSHISGNALLEKEQIHSFLSQKFQSMKQKSEVSKEEVIRELGKIAFSNGCDFAKVVERKTFVDGEEISLKETELANIDEIPKDKQAAIANIKVSKTGISITPYDKIKALELLGKHFGLFSEKVQVSSKEQVQILDDIPVELEDE